MNRPKAFPRSSSLWLLPLVVVVFLLSACTNGDYGAESRTIDESAQAAIDRDGVGNFNYFDIDFIQQTREMTCGLAAFESVARYWGVEVSQNDEYLAFPPMDAIRGYSIEELKYVIESRGFYAFAVRGDDAFLRQQVDKGRPVIVPLRKVRHQFLPGAVTSAERIRRISISPTVGDNLDHYVVVVGYDERGYLIMDTADGFSVIGASLLAALRAPHGNAALLVAPGAGTGGTAVLRTWRPKAKPRRRFTVANGLNAMKWSSDEELNNLVTGRQ